MADVSQTFAPKNNDGRNYLSISFPSASVFEKARGFVKNVTGVLSRADGERSNCPRCKGTGLLTGRQFWDFNQPPPSDDPCWFCEGVGVMPVVGLNGFVLGRSKPILDKRYLNPRPRLPMQMQLYLGKYPETQCTLKTYKPSIKLCDLLFDPCQFPSWMNAGDGDATFSSVEDDGEFAETGDIFSPFNSSTKQPCKATEQRASQTRNTDSFRTRVSVPPRITRQPSISTSRRSQMTPYRDPYTQAIPATGQKQRSRNDRRGGSALTLKTSSGGRLITLRTTVSPPLRVATTQTVRTPSRRGSPGHRKAGETKKTGKSPVLRSPRASRSSRRERNRVREEAEKDAVERAHKFPKPATSQSELRTSIAADDSGSAWSAGNKSEGHGNLSLGEAHFVTDQHPWRRMLTSSKRISSEWTTINQFLYGKVRDGILRPPALGKPF